MRLFDKLEHSVPPEVAAAIKRAKHTLWVGTVSFEDRCLASVRCLEAADLKMYNAIAIEYPTIARPEREDYERRKVNRQRLTEFGSKLFLNETQIVTLNPYALQDFFKIFFEENQIKGESLVVFDITCMTKVHTLALASFLALHESPSKWICAYTIPENYTSIDNSTRTPGWKDVIIAPLAETAHLLNESHSRGIIITGHEADRLLVAISELEPSGGLIIIGDTPSRPDLGRLSEQYNRGILKQLTKLRSSEWKKIVANILGLEKVKAEIKKEIKLAKGAEAPIILFPFGPKPLLFEIGHILVRDYPESTWFVYPVPNAYDVNYTEGVGKTYWFGTYE